jgi:hypothetical protein
MRGYTLDMRTEQEVRERLGLLEYDVKVINSIAVEALLSADLRTLTSLEDAIGELLWVLGEK